jgi:GRASP55/65 PDZ-like domain
MGQEASSEARADGEGNAAAGGIDVNTLQGYRVMKLFKGSPASRAGLAAFEDFIVAVDGALVDGDGALGSILKNAEGTPVSLTVWNCIDAQERTVTLAPAKWTGGPGLLGAAVRYEPVKGATDFVWRVVDVYRNSPADDCGLTPESDFLVGTPAQVFRTTDALSKLVKQAAKAKVASSILVYSTSTARTRCIDIVPSSDWGGEGLLGCELATGLLHRINRNLSD